MSKYDSKQFVDELVKKMQGRDIPNCPYCGGDKFSTTPEFANIVIGDELGSINLGPSIPAGMLVCENCGHIEFFALGALGFLRNKEDKKNGK